jgi:hypothetical protein
MGSDLIRGVDLTDDILGSKVWYGKQNIVRIVTPYFSSLSQRVDLDESSRDLFIYQNSVDDRGVPVTS